MNARLSIQNAVFGEGINNPVNPSQAKTVSSIKKPNHKKSQEKFAASTTTTTSGAKRDHKDNNSRSLTNASQQLNRRIAENPQNGNPTAKDLQKKGNNIQISIPGCPVDSLTHSMMEKPNVIKKPITTESDEKTTDEKSSIVAPLPTTISDKSDIPNKFYIDSRSADGIAPTSSHDDDFLSLIGRADGRVSELDLRNEGVTSVRTTTASETSNASGLSS